MLTDLQQQQLRLLGDVKRNHRRRNLKRTSQFDVKRKETMKKKKETEPSAMYWKPPRREHEADEKSTRL
jgi:hypothetical protein